MISEKYIKNKDEILELCQELCKLNAHENDMVSPERMEQIEREIDKRIYYHTELGDRALTDDILNWYWNVMYLKDMTDAEWIMWWFFGIKEE